MSFRTIVISKQSKLSYKNNHLIVRNEETIMVHLSEIHTIMVEETATSITSYLIAELLKRKIKVIFCDEKRSPIGELLPYHASFNSSKKIWLQSNWDSSITDLVWSCIIGHKILNQVDYLKKLSDEKWKKISNYLNELEIGDPTNREGHAAKVYFNALFGLQFNRELQNDINAALDYGYTIILSSFNREININGYITQLGMKHKNEFNPFNLSCDLMEPFRVLIDEIVYNNKNEDFNNDYKRKLIDVLNKKVTIAGKEQYVSNAIAVYTKSVFKAIEKQDVKQIKFFDYV